MLQKRIDWQLLLHLARQHRLLPLMYHHLKAHSEAVPSSVIRSLEDYFLRTFRRNLALSGELLQILQLFQSKGIPCIPFKGLTLNSSLYGHLGLRECDDLDLLVREEHVSRVTRLLLAGGYRPQAELPAGQETRYLQSQRQYLFCHSRTGVLVEVHWALTPQFFPFPMDFSELWNRSGQASLCGEDLRSISAEDLMLVLCVHGAKHLWERLIWISDLAELLKASPDLDWDLIIRQARSRGGLRMLSLGLMLASDLLGSTPSEKANPLLRAAGPLQRLAFQIYTRLLEQRGSPDTFEGVRFHVRVRERRIDKAGYLMRYAFAPTAGDWTLLSLPEPLPCLAYAIRPLRILARNGTAVCRRQLELQKKRLVRKWSRFYRLTGKDRCLLLKLAGRLFLIRFIPGLSNRLCRTALRESAAMLSNTVTASRHNPRVAEVLQAVNTLGSIPGFRSTCLERSLTLWWLLQAEGITSQLTIGVRRQQERLEAHAWLDQAGVPLNESDDIASRYLPLL